MKKFLCLIISTIMIISFTGCGLGSNNEKLEVEVENVEMSDINEMSTPEDTVTLYISLYLYLDEKSCRNFAEYDNTDDFKKGVTYFIETYQIKEISDISIYECNKKGTLAFAVAQFKYQPGGDVKGKMYYTELFLLRRKDNKWYLTTYDRTNDEEKIWINDITNKINSDSELKRHEEDNIKIINANKEFFEKAQKRSTKLFDDTNSDSK